MQHIYGVCKLGDVDNAPLAQHMDTNFHGPLPNLLHGLPIDRHQTLLDEVQLEAGDPAGFCREVLKVVLAGAEEFVWLHWRDYTSSLINYQKTLIRVGRALTGNYTGKWPPNKAQ
jgi:hypothetical protein